MRIKYLIFLLSVLLWLSVISGTNRSAESIDELQLRRFALSHLFYHYKFNNLLARPLRIIGDSAIIKFPEKEYHLPLELINYTYVVFGDSGEEKYLFLFDILKNAPGDNHREQSLIDGGQFYFNASGEKDQNLLSGAAFYNSLFSDSRISIAELKEKLGRTPYFFRTLDEAYQSILETFPLFKENNGRVHLVDGGFVILPDSPMEREIKFNNISVVKVMDLVGVSDAPDTLLQNNIFFWLEQVNEDVEKFRKPDSTVWLPIYTLNRKYIENAYKLEDALIFLASF